MVTTHYLVEYFPGSDRCLCVVFRITMGVRTFMEVRTCVGNVLDTFISGCYIYFLGKRKDLVIDLVKDLAMGLSKDLAGDFVIESPVFGRFDLPGSSIIPSDAAE